MNKQPLVSVFIPLYNCEAFIEETLESLRVQTYKNLEIVVVNDGSTDHSVELVENFPDKRIKLYHNPCNKGIPYTRNRGLEYATGEYFAFLDSDDIAAPDRIEKSVAFLEAHPDIHMVCGRYDKLVDGELKHNTYKMGTYRYLDGDVLFNMPVLTSTWMLRSALYREHDLKFSETYFCMQDYQFLADALRYSSIVELNEKFGVYRIGHASITAVSKKKRQAERVELFRTINLRALDSLDIQLTEEQKQIHLDSIQNQGKEYSLQQLKEWKQVLFDIVSQYRNKRLQPIIAKAAKRRYSYAVATSKISLLAKVKMTAFRFPGESYEVMLKRMGKACLG